MPTVSNHDVLGPMTWGAGGNTRQRYFPQDSLDRSDTRGGINSILFGEGNGAAGACAGYASSASEHAYASGAGGACQSVSTPQRSSFVSDNGYYGYHQRHHPGPADDAGLGQDCSMDISENNLPAHAFGQHPSDVDAFGSGGPQHFWHADPDPLRNQTATRKRHFEARGVGAGAEAGAGAPAEDAAERAVKRTRSSPGNDAHHLPEASSQAMAEAFGLHANVASIAEQSHFQAQMYDLPIQQLPGSTSQLANAITPRPRCLMGHFI